MDLSENFTPSRLEINLLGRFEVYIDGQIVHEALFKGRKTRYLLKLIAHQRHHQIVREHVIDLLWPELDVTSASAQLYKALHRIRKAFTGLAEHTEDWIQITDDLIRMKLPDGLRTDIQQFEQAARTGLRDRKIAELEKAVSIYAGDFLPMDRYEEWASLPREHYRQLYLDVLTALANEYEQLGDFSEAAEMFRLALEKDSALEIAHQGLMRIFARKGQSTRAYRQYDLCRKVLGVELGMSPSAETRKILDDIREEKIAREEVQDTFRTNVPGPAQPIIGRSKEGAIIDRHIDDLTDGNGGVLLVSGEPGIGKTRLIQEITYRLRRREISFFLGHSNENTGNLTFEPFIELFRDVLRSKPEMKTSLPAELGSLIPGYTGVGLRAQHADQLAAKEYLFSRVHHFISQLASKGPIAVLIENFQLADKASHELFSYLIQHRSELPVLFVASLRKELDEPVSAFISNLQKHNAEQIELQPLSYDDHVNLLHQHAISGVSTAAAERIFSLSEGNPLIALELLKFHIEENASEPAEYSDNSEESVLMNPQKIPPSLRYMVDQKLEGLSPAAHHLLYIATVIGRQVPYERMATVWSGGSFTEEEELFNALEEVIRARLLEERGLDYSFRHALVREVVYSSISEPRRQALHRLIADQLVKISDNPDEEPVEQIAHHYLHSGQMFKSALYLLRAGKRAEEVYAHDDALLHYTKACEILELVHDEEVQKLKCQVLERIGDVYRACGRLEKSYSAYEEVLSLAQGVSLDNSTLVELYRKLAVVAIFRTETDRSEVYLEKAFERVGEDARAQARLFITKALQLWHLNQLEEAYSLAKDALEKATEVEADTEASQACEILAMTCLPLGRWDEGLEYEMRRQIYGWSPEVVVATDAHLCLWEYHVSGELPLQKARRFMEKVAEQATGVGDLRCVAVCHYALGTMYLWRGERRKAVEELASSLMLHEKVGSPAGMAYALARKSALHTLMGATDLGWQAVREGFIQAENVAVRDHCLQRLYGVGIWNRLEADDLGQSRHLVEESEKLLEETGACAACALELYPWLAYYYLRTKQYAQAKRCGDAISDLAGKTGNPIGKSMAAMIASSMNVIEQNYPQAERHSRESFEILKGAVSEISHSPVVHFLDRMIEQQPELKSV